jgi:AraC family transcriptional regulator, regulatory protein of adaptative response / methylated-DNA-[protein]-cysteine methyltransferase
MQDVVQEADTRRWRAVLDRDPASDGEFFYGVTSTGIYCRPTCPSRRPLRSRVSFFGTVEAAEAAGYRACRRCQPRNSQSPAVHQVMKARQYLDDHLDETLTLEQLGQLVGMSPFHLQRTFKKVVGVSPKAYIAAMRLRRMKAELRKGVTVSRATYDAGYASGSRAYEHARAGMGMTPGSYRKGGQGQTIRYVVVGTPLGELLVAATDRGLCSVMLGDTAAELEASLRQEYPAASLESGDGILREYAEQIVSQIRGGDPRSLPLDITGTDFQRQVWEALRRIPLGQTRSYQAIAAELGRPSAVRAVAQACAQNRLAVVIPCHRVIRQSGELGGYRWGLERKQRLLDRERSAR